MLKVVQMTGGDPLGVVGERGHPKGWTPNEEGHVGRLGGSLTAEGGDACPLSNVGKFEARGVLGAFADWEVGDTESEQQKSCPQGGLGWEACATGDKLSLSLDYPAKSGQVRSNPAIEKILCALDVRLHRVKWLKRLNGQMAGRGGAASLEPGSAGASPYHVQESPGAPSPSGVVMDRQA
jgi:hypothetical protein